MSKQRLVLVIAILASFVAFLDGSVVNVALPAIVREFGGGLSLQQWVVDAYLITLGALILIAGSFSDMFGRKKVLLAGLIGFLLTSILCALAPSGTFLIIARALQGVAGALLVPSSLALIMQVFSGSGQGKAIGSWTAWTGIAFVVGPLLGGFLVDTASWRLIFAINILPIGVTLWLLKSLNLAHDVEKNAKIDVLGTVLCAVGLGGICYGLIEQGRYGLASPLVYLSLILGLAFLIGFVLYEKQARQPMMPLDLFKVRNFYVGNLATLTIYGGLAVATFLITIFLQQVSKYSAIEAGLALLPVTIVLFLLSPRFGALSEKYGPRFFMTFGPLIAAAGFLSMLQSEKIVAYWSQLFPGVLLFGLGLSITVAPLTSAILGSINSRKAGIASAINNAVARVAGLLAVAALSFVVGSTLDLASFKRGLIATAILLAAGGIISGIGIVNPAKGSK